MEETIGSLIARTYAGQAIVPAQVQRIIEHYQDEIFEREATIQRVKRVLEEMAP